MNPTIIQSAYLVAAVLFILGLRNLSPAKTAVTGNLQAAVGMLVAIVATLVDSSVISYEVVLASILVGSLAGAELGLRIEMTVMPLMVAAGFTRVRRQTRV